MDALRSRRSMSYIISNGSTISLLIDRSLYYWKTCPEKSSVKAFRHYIDPNTRNHGCRRVTLGIPRCQPCFLLVKEDRRTDCPPDVKWSSLRLLIDFCNTNLGGLITLILQTHCQPSSNCFQKNTRIGETKRWNVSDSSIYCLNHVIAFKTTCHFTLIFCKKLLSIRAFHFRNVCKSSIRY